MSMKTVISLLIFLLIVALPFCDRIYAQERGGLRLLGLAEDLVKERRYIEASEILIKTLVLLEKSGGDNKLNIARCLHLMIDVHLETNKPDRFDYKAAYARVYAIYNEELEESNPIFIEFLHSYATIVDDPFIEETLHRRRIRILSRKYGEKHYETGNAIIDLADFLHRAERFEEAKAAFIEASTAVEVRKADLDRLGVDSSPRYVRQMQLSVKRAYEMARYEGLKDIFEETQEMEKRDSVEAALQQDSLLAPILRMNEALKDMYLSQDEINAQKDPEARKNLERRSTMMQANLLRMPGLQMLTRYFRMLGMDPAQYSKSLINAALENPDDYEAVHSALDAILETKAMSLEAEEKGAALFLNHQDSSLAALLIQREEITRQITALSMSKEESKTDSNEKKLEILKERRQFIEKDLADWGENLSRKELIEAEDPFAVMTKQLTKQHEYAKEIAKALTHASAYIEYVSYGGGYVAFLVEANQKARVFDLGSASSIDALIDTFRTELSLVPNMGNMQRQLAYKRIKDITNNLYQKLIEPLGIRRISKLFISPESKLYTLPFETLTLPSGGALIDRHTINYVVTGRDLLSFEKNNRQGDLFIFADPDFDNTSSNTEPTYNTFEFGNNTRSTALLDPYYESLPGTREEAKAISVLLNLDDNQLFLGPNASEAKLTSLQPPWRLHIATHGFFLGNQAESIMKAGTDNIVDSIEALQERYEFLNTISYENHMLRSGLVLSGANKFMEIGGDYDGIVTAYELANMNPTGYRFGRLISLRDGLRRNS